jgi:hypothetical protein
VLGRGGSFPYRSNQAILFGPDGGMLWDYAKSKPVPNTVHVDIPHQQVGYLLMAQAGIEEQVEKGAIPVAEEGSRFAGIDHLLRVVQQERD